MGLEVYIVASNKYYCDEHEILYCIDLISTLQRYYGKQNHKSSNKKYQQNNDALSAFLKLADNGTVQNGSSLRRSVSIDYDGNLSFRTLDAENISNSTGFKKEKSLGRHVSGSHSSDFIGMSGSQGYLGNSQSRGGLSFHKKEKKGVVKEATSVSIDNLIPFPLLKTPKTFMK